MGLLGPDQPGTWPLPDDRDDDLNRYPEPAWLEAVGRRVRHRLAQCQQPPVVGHADWEEPNLRWIDRHLYVVHDWDSVVSRPEAALAGVAAAVCPAFGGPGQPPWRNPRHSCGPMSRCVASPGVWTNGRSAGRQGCGSEHIMPRRRRWRATGKRCSRVSAVKLLSGCAWRVPSSRQYGYVLRCLPKPKPRKPNRLQSTSSLTPRVFPAVRCYLASIRPISGLNSLQAR